jgi:glycosyltransferase involved in cell wall biosynthesis
MILKNSTMLSRIGRKIRRERDFIFDWIREQAEMMEEKRLLEEARNGMETCWEAEDEPEPLVTVRVATYNAGDLLAERALPSILNQSYKRIQVLVVGDHCDERTANVVRSFEDPRIEFINLPARGNYPQYRAHRRKVAGSHPMNVALTLAAGKWIAPCDDDDAFTPDHVETLLNAVRSARAEMVYSKALCETRPDKWEECGAEPLACGKITHGSVLYAAALRFMKHSNTSWKLHGEPSDWNLWKRMKRIGVKIAFVNHVTYKHFLGAYQRDILERDSDYQLSNLASHSQPVSQ